MSDQKREKKEKLRQELKNVRARAHELEKEVGLAHSPKDAQDLLKVTLEQMHEGIQIVDRSLRYLYLNEAAVRHSQSEKHSLLGRTMMECFPGIENTEMYSVLNSVLKYGKPQVVDNLFEYPDGTSCWFELHLEPHALGVLIRSIDITSRKKVEEQYLHSQRMEAVGLLAGGIAHDFNNKLGVMTLYCEMVLADLEKQSLHAEHLGEVLTTIQEASDLTQQLLAFSRKQVLDLKVVNLNDLINRTRTSLARLLGEKVNIQTALDPELSNVKVDPSQMDQVILNLAINARDAMPDGGVLTIETACVELDETYSAEHPNVIPGDYVMLAFSDTGTGMSPEVKARIFDPFFTTKPIGQGTGLGLASVHGIVHQSRGHIWVYSEEGIGTTFKLYFPRVAEAKLEPQPTPEPIQQKGAEKILLVEDDERLLNAFQLALTNAGYTVCTAATAKEAKSHFMRGQGEFDMLLTDVVFADSSGPKLAEELMAINPSLKVVFMSGYTESAMTQNGALKGQTVLIQKPVSTRKLLSALRQVFEGAIVRGVI